MIYHLENGSEIIKCKEVRYYQWENKTLKYYPDFLVNGKIYEIKGYHSDKWEAKSKANPDVITLYRNEMEPILDYVITRYGKNFIELYE